MNTLKGTITAIRSSAMISLITVTVDGDNFSSIILEGSNGDLHYQKGDAVHLVFKETEVGLAKGLSGHISLRNRFSGCINKIEKGDVLSKVILKYKNHIIESVISTQSVEDMNLQKKDEVEWLVKTNEVSLMDIPQ